VPWDELLSVFCESDRKAAEVALRDLIDARLLTSYEIQEEDQEPTRRVEIIHESLLANWPRLVRWQTQDADAAQLRDQLRQAARTWDEHDRSDDMLWMGSAYREFASWQERYPGGLTDTEEAFGDAMTALAGRRRRRRRIAVAAGFAVLLAGLAIVGSFWQRSVREARRAEAQKLIALGQLELEGYPSAAVAHAIASLELADTPESRRLALEALWRGPTAQVVNQERLSPRASFGADDSWLVYSIEGSLSEVRILHADGSSKTLDRIHQTDRINVFGNPESNVILTWGETWKPAPQHFVLWSAPDGRRLGEVRYEGDVQLRGLSWNAGRALFLMVKNDQASVDAVSFDGTRKRLGTLEIDPRTTPIVMDEKNGRWLGAVVDNEVLVFEIGEDHISKARRLGKHEGSRIRVAFDPLGRFFATADTENQIRLWDPAGASQPTVLN